MEVDENALDAEEYMSYKLSAPRISDSRGFTVTWEPLPVYPETDFLLVEREYSESGQLEGANTYRFDNDRQFFERQFPTLGNHYSYSVCGLHPQTNTCIAIHGKNNFMEALGHYVEIYEGENPKIIVPANAVGSTPYEADVDRKGNAHISIPIRVPAGTNGLQPAININYNSSGASAVNTVHYTNHQWEFGWDLGGFSKIYRCNKGQKDLRYTWYTRDSDTYLNWFDGDTLPELEEGQLPLRGRPPIRYTGEGSNDGLCLDDKQLILVEGVNFREGAVYRMANEAFKRITIKNKPGNRDEAQGIYFQVEQPDGRVTRYGYDSGSSVRLGDNPKNHEFSWAINDVIDKFGNNMSFEYYVFSDFKSGDTVFSNANDFFQVRDDNGELISDIVFTAGPDLVPSTTNEQLLRFRPKSITYSQGKVEFKLFGDHQSITVTGANASSARVYNIYHEKIQSGSSKKPIAKLQECEGGSCLSPLKFNYVYNTATNKYGGLGYVEDGVGALTKFHYDTVNHLGCGGNYRAPFSSENSRVYAFEWPHLPRDLQFMEDLGARWHFTKPGAYCRGEHGSSGNPPEFPVVTKLEKSNGINGGFNSWSYRYGDSGLNSSTGKGFLGFGMRRVTDDQTGITTYTEYALRGDEVGEVLRESQYPGVYNGILKPIYEEVNRYSSISVDVNPYDANSYGASPNTSMSYLAFKKIKR